MSGECCVCGKTFGIDKDFDGLFRTIQFDDVFYGFCTKHFKEAYKEFLFWKENKRLNKNV